MLDHKTIAQSLADGLNGIVRAGQTFSLPQGRPEMERWTREMTEASRHVLLAFGLEPSHLNNPSIPCGGGWFVERGPGDADQWHAVQR